MTLETSTNAKAKPERKSGRCKWFNVVKGYGFITPDDGTPDVFLHQTVIQMPGFRSLADDEEVEFECKETDKGLEATFVCGPEGTDCKGSERRPVSKKKYKKLRCYNCGDFSNHVAAKCPKGPMPKRCHLCKSDNHLVADCPNRKGTEGCLVTVASPDKPHSHQAEESNGSSSGGGGRTEH
ncbi:hypothetical protein HELRODRAFT_163427 [Helobdella robusta]|uniref:CSD domain-containing protein n=1 Tax=Helobdella robusta TaxID=6412 RepID=T1EU12_HELRO|nr:hypothetical protein HELRODRAFT_163427 [Helobdella robusta]ESN96369.1 hypothetical protein HELRODRAFT_163427 [Helobdella robusta]